MVDSLLIIPYHFRFLFFVRSLWLEPRLAEAVQAQYASIYLLLSKWRVVMIKRSHSNYKHWFSKFLFIQPDKHAVRVRDIGGTGNV